MGLFKRNIKKQVEKVLEANPPVITAAVHAQRVFHSKLAGVPNYTAALKKCKPGERLWLVREPKNPYDPNAISVWSQAKKQVGYIKKELAADLAPQMDRGVWIEVTIAEITGGTKDKPSMGCNILIQFEQVTDL